jgi:hypothetical protein
MELVRAVHDTDLVTVFELAPGGIEAGEPEGTPWAREVRPDLDLHLGHPMAVRHAARWDPSVAGHP